MISFRPWRSKEPEKPMVDATIAGVDVLTNPSSSYPDGWYDTLEEWLPVFDGMKWLDGLTKIVIGDDVVNGTGVGQYNTREQAIYVERDPTMDWLEYEDAFVGEDKKHLLTHEMVHHAHITIHGYTAGSRDANHEEELKKTVSYYSAKNINEAVAEIGTGIIHGIEYPDWVHDYYNGYEGPVGVYSL